ncbi:DNA/RNA nuclease SfsA [Alkaliphilus serpentinus]|uniref:Sugar fermentation stimulation protein homolog n=1 Tax=Alkaliphilus serpentinus TaxID=1482731 RepID=A0A833HMJ8_9FIRM|nr:DNA/RNA nuclease SfsA [Alkaliphilus serpentinus]KAB3527618.1 DNA/RNA nuclease SfsA [Alkaliphilus serpentinus]
MKLFIDGEMHEATFIKRHNRFIAEILLDGERHLTHVPNTGRMRELLLEGARVIVRKVDNPLRKTQYDLLMVYTQRGILVAIDSKLPNRILNKAFQEGSIPEFRQYNYVKAEVTFGKSKFDFSLSNNNSNALVEAKCVTLVKENKMASFPDAPTERGTRHLLELIEAKSQGIEAAVFFIIQREDSIAFTPNQEMDKAFYGAMLKAIDEGVEFYAYNSIVKNNTVKLKDRLEIRV